MTRQIRPAGSGSTARAWTFMRHTTSPRAAIVIGADGDPPSDWPVAPSGASDAQLSHLAGWNCEVRADDVVLMNPLGEGTYKAALPSIDAAWEEELRFTGSAAVYLLPFVPESADPAGAVDGAAAMGQALAATVRTAFSADYGKAAPVGRNAPCPCGSGKKHKQCCGRKVS